jgi:DNA-binding MarR family transcriptional regulator
MEDRTEPRWLDAEEQQNWYALAYALIRLPAALDAQMQRDAGLSHFEYLVLSGLSMMPNRTQRLSELAVHTASTLSRLSNVVTRLERRGWVSRTPDLSDGRYTLATLTEDGWAKVAASAPGHVNEVRRLVLDPLTKAQQQQMGRIAQRILKAIDPDTPRIEDCLPEAAPPLSGDREWS